MAVYIYVICHVLLSLHNTIMMNKYSIRSFMQANNILIIYILVGITVLTNVKYLNLNILDIYMYII